MSGQPTLQAAFDRLAKIAAAAKPPPTAEQVAEAERVMASIEALRAMAANTKARDPAAE
jgi:hypothetical protein